MDTQLKALPTLLSSLGAFCLFELRVSRHFSTFYGPSVQAMDIPLGARHPSRLGSRSLYPKGRDGSR
jgi:hypothetical protein